jgi:3-methyladenine DNA glycosylase/8-oxoguanine DNA glycosylase
MEHSLAFLKRHAKFAPLIKKHGKPDLDRYHGKMKIFSSILRSMIYQQISGKAAKAIHDRFLVLFPKTGPTPALLLKIPTTKLRAAGLSKSKIEYMRDAARKFKDGTIREKDFPSLASDEIIVNLTEIKGVGVWTAHMLLIFTLKRLDILPTGDLGIQKGFKILYKLRSLPDHDRMEKLAMEWREHASVASWYLWRVADGAKR